MMQTRVQQSTVDDFMRIAGQLIAEIAAYSGAGVNDETVSANVRQLRVMSAALNSALMTVAMMPQPLVAMPQPPIVETSSAPPHTHGEEPHP